MMERCLTERTWPRGYPAPNNAGADQPSVPATLVGSQGKLFLENNNPPDQRQHNDAATKDCRNAAAAFMCEVTTAVILNLPVPHLQ
jgi:hypothetical protein